MITPDTNCSYTTTTYTTNSSASKRLAKRGLGLALIFMTALTLGEQAQSQQDVGSDSPPLAEKATPWSISTSSGNLQASTPALKEHPHWPRRSVHLAPVPLSRAQKEVFRLLNLDDPSQQPGGEFVIAAHYYGGDPTTKSEARRVWIAGQRARIEELKNWHELETTFNQRPNRQQDATSPSAIEPTQRLRDTTKADLRYNKLIAAAEADLRLVEAGGALPQRVRRYFSFDADPEGATNHDQIGRVIHDLQARGLKVDRIERVVTTSQAEQMRKSLRGGFLIGGAALGLTALASPSLWEWIYGPAQQSGGEEATVKLPERTNPPPSAQ